MNVTRTGNFLPRDVQRAVDSVKDPLLKVLVAGNRLRDWDYVQRELRVLIERGVDVPAEFIDRKWKDPAS